MFDFKAVCIQSKGGIPNFKVSCSTALKISQKEISSRNKGVSGSARNFAAGLSLSPTISHFQALVSSKWLTAWPSNEPWACPNLFLLNRAGSRKARPRSEERRVGKE